MKGFHPRTFFSKAWLPALSACLALAACRGKTLDPDAGTEDEGTTSAGTLKEKTSLVNSSAALKWPSVNEETRQSGLTQRAIGNGGIAVMPILQGDRSPANWDFCYENNTPSATRCQWASSDILAKVGQRPTIIQAFQLNVYTSGKRYNGTIGSPTTGTSDANWTIELQGAWIKTAVLGFDSASGALTLTSGRTELIAGANPGACALSNVNAVGHDTGHAKVLTGIHLMDEANPDPTGGNGGAAVLNNFYVAGRLRAGKVWVAGMIPAPKSGDPYYVDFVPSTVRRARRPSSAINAARSTQAARSPAVSYPSSKTRARIRRSASLQAFASRGVRSAAPTAARSSCMPSSASISRRWQQSSKARSSSKKKSLPKSTPSL
jgi:hypothetical protein